MSAISMIATAAALLMPLATAAAPAGAATPAASALLTAANGQTPTRPAPTSRPTRYCFVDQITGSRIQTRTCQTLDAWLAQGIDPRTPR